MYMTIIERFVPEEKRGAKKFRVIASVIAYTVVLATVGLFIWAGVLFQLGKRDSGFVVLGVAIVVSIIQLLAAIGVRMNNKEK